MERALVTDKLTLNITEDTVSFAWFQFNTNPDELSVYTEFVSRLCALARKLKRLSSCTKLSDNDKYAFTCFLLRVGFIGDEYKKPARFCSKTHRQFCIPLQ